MNFQFLVDNKTENRRYMAEWGPSILIETGGKKILMDAILQRKAPMGEKYVVACAGDKYEF